MTSAFNSWQDFFNMNGYAFEVWGAFLVAALTICIMILAIYTQHQKAKASALKKLKHSSSTLLAKKQTHDLTKHK